MTDTDVAAKTIPRDGAWDSTLALRREGYRFISRRCKRLRTELFETHLLCQPVVCMTGADAARLFYDPERFQRSGAAPARLRKTLFGEGGVQGLDGKAHLHRKAMFMSLMTPAAMVRLDTLAVAAWDRAIDTWAGQKPIVLRDGAAQVLCRAVCDWAGVPLAEDALPGFTHRLLQLIESPSRLGFAHWRGRRARRQLERYCAGLVQQLRDGQLDPGQGTALEVIAHHREAGDGRLLPAGVAAVELLNVLRPTVAIAHYVVMIALALHRFPLAGRGLDDEGRVRFVQEVRRYYPFFPAAMAVVAKTFLWRGYRFVRGRRVLLDLYGTNHDPRLWRDPERFYPDRLLDLEIDPYSMIPQGGGDHWQHHRCAGEWLTVNMMTLALRVLTQRMRYQVPVQDLTLRCNRMPALPASGFIIQVTKRI